MNDRITIIGAGLAGCEAAWQAAVRGAKVTLIEMKPHRYSPAHHNPGFAELVCSNSLRSDQLSNAAGLLKSELRKLGSLIMEAADANSVPAGSSLAVDREKFSDYITSKIRNHPNIEVVEREADSIGDGINIIATGPLTSDALSVRISELVGEGLHFFDAAAPIVDASSLDMDKVFLASRYGKGEACYLNCPMTKEQYDTFYNELINAKEAELHDFDRDEQAKEDLTVFEGCMPVEVMAKRGFDTLRYGPLKPVGLRDPKTGQTPYAVVQLRRDNREGSLYNIVGFQTHLKFGEQKRVFSMIPGLGNAEFVRYGVMHRNTYIKSPGVLNQDYSVKGDENLYFAGQMTGVEGYVESAASGLYAGLSLACKIKGQSIPEFPQITAIGALGIYVSSGSVGDFQPININFGIIPPLEVRVKVKKEKNAAIAARSLETIDEIAKNLQIGSMTNENNA